MTDENVVPMIPPSGDRPVTWNDLQDLRRGLEGVFDVKLEALESSLNNQLLEIRTIMVARLDAQDRLMSEIKKLLKN